MTDHRRPECIDRPADVSAHSFHLGTCGKVRPANQSPSCGSGESFDPCSEKLEGRHRAAIPKRRQTCPTLMATGERP